MSASRRGQCGEPIDRARRVLEIHGLIEHDERLEQRWRGIRDGNEDRPHAWQITEREMTQEPATRMREQRRKSAGDRALLVKRLEPKLVDEPTAPADPGTWQQGRACPEQLAAVLVAERDRRRAQPDVGRFGLARRAQRDLLPSPLA
ncbi:MAG: hypothetical protein H0T79_10415, partial [Deltaproteobacteria bacterium]|nr:hypothetical protein [Deltaproteobacteria bacterium]